MKRTIALCVLTSSLMLINTPCLAWSGREEFLMYTCLSQQIRLCQIAGVGTVSTNFSDAFIINVENYWLGNPGSNTLNIVSDIGFDDDGMPQTGEPVVFFATKTCFGDDTTGFMNPCMLQFGYPSNTTNILYRPELYTLGNSRAYFDVTAENGLMLPYASNLVSALRVSPDLDTYYDLIRTKDKNPNFGTKSVQENRSYSLGIGAIHDGTNLLLKIATDTNAIPSVRNIAIGRLYDDFGVTNLSL